MNTRTDLLNDLERLESRLISQIRLADGTRLEIQAVKAQLAMLSVPDEPRGVANSFSAEVKVALFRSLFRGREDVFPRLWVSKKQDKKGYSPVCANERNPLLCDKFKVKCAECPRNQQVSSRSMG